MEVFPREIVQLICTFLDVPHVVSLSSCSRSLLTAINSESLWKRLRPNRRQVIIENLESFPEGKYYIKFTLDFAHNTVYPYRPYLKSLVNVRDAEIYRTEFERPLPRADWCYVYDHCRIWTLFKKFCIPLPRLSGGVRNILVDDGYKTITDMGFIFKNTFVHVEGEDFSVAELLAVPKTRTQAVHISLEQLKAWEGVIDRKLKLIRHVQEFRDLYIAYLIRDRAKRQKLNEPTLFPTTLLN